jgi:TRAP-type C4-dicarboxylate transport system permease small subunit
MKFYADRPIRRTAQVLADLAALSLAVFAIWLGTEVHAQVMKLRAPGDGLIDAGSGLRSTFDSAADNADDVPLVGTALANALHTGSDAGVKLSQAGQWQVEAVTDLALWMAVILIAIPVVFLLATWLPLRVRFVRRATAGVHLQRLGEEGYDLLALRALVTQPLPRLAKAGEVTTGWRNQDPAVIRKLAHWELERLGLDS